MTVAKTNFDQDIGTGTEFTLTSETTKKRVQIQNNSFQDIGHQVIKNNNHKETGNNHSMIALAYFQERISRPWCKEGKPRGPWQYP